jgi:hypothetical protein
MRTYPMNFLEIAVGLSLVAFAGIMQISGTLAFSGIVPNVSYAALAVLSFFTASAARYFLFVFAAVLVLQVHSDMALALLAVGAVAIGAFVLAKKLPWTPLLSCSFLLAAGTPVFYAIADLGFLIRDPFTVFAEMTYNVVIGLFLYFIVKSLMRYERKTRPAF